MDNILILRKIIPPYITLRLLKERKKIIFVHKFVHYNFSLRCLILLQESATVYSDDENDTKQQENRKHEHELRTQRQTLTHNYAHIQTKKHTWSVFFSFLLSSSSPLHIPHSYSRCKCVRVCLCVSAVSVSECVRVRLSCFGTVRVKIVLAKCSFLYEHMS